MLFNSIDFAIFLPLVFVVYWFVLDKQFQWQNGWLLLASYFFYGWWDWRFLILLVLSTTVDYWVGRRMFSATKDVRRKQLLWISIFVNLTLLLFFKYFHFFQLNFIQAFSFFGLKFQAASLQIILPVGISFYTFQTLSYSIDVYQRKIEPECNYLAYAAYVGFFPQLVAGPIERATHLLPQFLRLRQFQYKEAVLGLRQILWGLFKKVVIADSCAELANLIFDHSDQYSGGTLFLGAVFFAFQIYGDFSGYSDMAIGIARLFGFSLMKNFSFPYFSKNVGEFWRRWHISLSTWFRDYVYIPLGGSRGGIWMTIRNIFLVFLVCGFWHGANWTFISWGICHALFYLGWLLVRGSYVRHRLRSRLLTLLVGGGKMLFTFMITTLAWVFFRAETFGHAIQYYSKMLLLSLPKGIDFIGASISAKVMVLWLLLFMIVEWIGRNKEFAMETVGRNWPRPVRYLVYYAMIITIIYFSGRDQPFIYFQF